MNRGLILLLSLPPSLILAGCGEAPHSAGSSPPPKAGVYHWLGREKVGEAIALLEKGNAAPARRILIDVLKRQPSDAVARSLVKQIDTDPRTLLGNENFTYRSRADDSFSSLAQRFLGNPTLFYALARYNGITVPGALVPDTALRIPGIEKHEAPQPARTEPTPPSRPAETSPPAAPRPVATVRPADPRRAARLRAAGLEQMNRGAIVRAVALLEQAHNLDPANPLIQRDLERANRIRRTVQNKP